MKEPAAGGYSPVDNHYRYYTAAQLPVLRRIVFLRSLGIGVDPLKHLKATGALDNPEKLEAGLAGRAETARQEISSLESLLDRIQLVLARMRAEGQIPVMGQYAVGVKQVPAMEARSNWQGTAGSDSPPCTRSLPRAPPTGGSAPS